jgi:hypothetical protein
VSRVYLVLDKQRSMGVYPSLCGTEATLVIFRSEAILGYRHHTVVMPFLFALFFYVRYNFVPQLIGLTILPFCDKLCDTVNIAQGS